MRSDPGPVIKKKKPLWSENWLQVKAWQEERNKDQLKIKENTRDKLAVFRVWGQLTIRIADARRF